jgi:hypothetical protein
MGDIQRNPRIAADGAMGAFIVWDDFRSRTHQDVYIQWVDSFGRVQWIDNGVKVGGAADDQRLPQVVPDGAGGAIVAWEDSRDGNWDIYAQRVDASGTPLWTLNGVVLCDDPADQYNFHMIADGEGGAIVAWEDERNFAVSGASLDLYTQKISADGVTRWASDGRMVTDQPAAQRHVRMIPDGHGGAILVWEDMRNELSSNLGWDVYASRIRTTGASAWTTGVSMWSDNQLYPELVTDGEGGAIIAWADNRNILSENDLYTQRVDSTGVSLWTPNGSALSKAAGSDYGPKLVSDGANGAIVVWKDQRHTDNDLYAQRIMPDSVLAWGPAGVAVCVASGVQNSHGVVTDGAGGAVVIWHDDRQGPGERNIYAQRVNATGVIEWDAEGIAISTADQDQYFPDVTTNGSGGAIAAWMDQRHSTDEDIYANMVTQAGGFVPTLLQSYSANWCDDGIAVNWRLSETGMDARFIVLRAVAPETDFAIVPNQQITGNHPTFQFVDRSCQPGTAYRYRVDVVDEDGHRTLFETSTVVAPQVELALHQNQPNPFNPSTTIAFSVPRISRVTLVVYDVRGRAVRTLLQRTLSAGRHEFDWDGKNDAGQPVSSGVYLYKLRANNRTLTRKMVLVE